MGATDNEHFLVVLVKELDYNKSRPSEPYFL